MSRTGNLPSFVTLHLPTKTQMYPNDPFAPKKRSGGRNANEDTLQEHGGCPNRAPHIAPEARAKESRLLTTWLVVFLTSERRGCSSD